MKVCGFCYFDAFLRLKMPWKFGLQKVDSSYHTALLRKQLIDVIVNCVNLIAAGMLMYVVIVYTMQGGSLKIRDTKMYPGSVNPKGKTDADYNMYLETLFAENYKWNHGGSDYPFTPENMPAHCRQEDVCRPFSIGHSQIGKIEVLSSYKARFSIIKCANGAAWDHNEDAYGYWKCGICSKGVDEECSNDWSLSPSEVDLKFCAFSNVHLQFLSEMQYLMSEISRDYLDAGKNAAQFIDMKAVPKVPSETSEVFRLNDYTTGACDAAIELFDSATNVTFKEAKNDNICELVATVSARLLEWIHRFCNKLVFTRHQYKVILYSLTEMADAACYRKMANKTDKQDCCWFNSTSDECDKTFSNCEAIGFDVSLYLKRLTRLSLKVAQDNPDLENLLITKLSILSLTDDVDEEEQPIVQIEVGSKITHCILLNLYDSIEENFIVSTALNDNCQFNISTMEAQSFAVFSGYKSAKKPKLQPLDERRVPITVKQYREILVQKIKDDALNVHKDESDFLPVDVRTEHHTFYSLFRFATILAYIISLTCFLATLATYGLFPKLRTERDSTKIKILLALCTCATLYIMTMCITIPFVSTSMGCQFALVMRVYLTLVTLTWSSIEAFYLYSAIVIIETYHQTRFMRKALVVGLGVPAAIVFIPVASSPELFTGHVSGCDWICTFPKFTQYYLFLLPISIAIALNLIIYGIAANFYLNNCSISDAKSDPRQCAWDDIKACFGLFALLVLSWLTSAFSVVNISSDGPAIFSNLELFCQILYILAIAGQGLYVFFVHCVAPPEARKQWIQIWKSFDVIRKPSHVFKFSHQNKGTKPTHGPVHHTKVPAKKASATSVRDRNGSAKRAKKSNVKIQNIPKITINNEYSSRNPASEV